MNRARRWAALAAIAFWIAAGPSSWRAAHGQVGRTYAVVVGVDRYDSDQIASLKYAGADARAVAEALHKAAGIPQEDIILMTSEAHTDRATSAKVLARLEGLGGVMRPGDTVIFFFSGHGVTESNESFLLTADADPQSVSMLRRTSIAVKDLQAAIRALPASRILLIVDACRNDPRSGKGASDNPLSKSLSRDLMLTGRSGGEVEAVVTLFSCKVGQRSYEGYEGHGYFTHFLVEGLYGRAATSKGVTIQSLVAYLEQRVPRAVKVRERRDQVPWADMSGSALSSWVLSRSKGSGPPSPTAAEASGIAGEWVSTRRESDPARRYEMHVAIQPDGSFSSWTSGENGPSGGAHARPLYGTWRRLEIRTYEFTYTRADEQVNQRLVGARFKATLSGDGTTLSMGRGQYRRK